MIVKRPVDGLDEINVSHIEVLLHGVASLDGVVVVIVEQVVEIQGHLAVHARMAGVCDC